MRISNPDRHFARYQRTGDPNALARVFDRLAPELLAVASHLVPDAAEAEDVVQATFLAAIERAPSFDPERSVRPWLMGILSRQAGLARRRLARAPEPERLPERSVEDPAKEAQRAELLRAVNRALERVPAPYAQVLAIHLAGDLRPAEIAARLGRRTGTVRVQLHRGLRLLRRALPAGLSAGAASSCRAPRGLSDIRDQVLQHANTGAPAAGAAPVLGGTGAWIMSKAGFFGAGALLVAVSVAFVVWPVEEAEAESGSVEVGRGELRVQPPREDPAGSSYEGREGGGEEVPSAAAERAPVGAARGSTGGPQRGIEETADGTPRVFRIEGRVADSGTGAGLAGARVTLWLPEGPEGERGHLVVESRSDGGFVAPETEAVPVSLTVSSDGHAPLHAQPFRGVDPSQAPATLDAGTLVVDRGVRVTGRVVDATTLRGVAGIPVFQFMALQEGVQRAKLGYGWRVAVTDDEGRFDLRERLPYTGMHPHGHGLLAASAAGIGWSAFEALEGGRDECEVRIELAPGPSLEVSVVDETGRPLADASVVVDPLFDPFAFLHRFEPEFWHGSGPELQGRLAGRTDAEGRAIFTALPLPQASGPARVRVEVAAAGAQRRAERVLAPTGLNELRVAFGAQEGYLVTGRVEDELGRPVPGATVSGSESETITDRAGRYELRLAEQELTAGQLVAQAAQHGRVTRRLDSREGAALRGFDFVLPPAAPIAGRVIDPDGDPVARCHVAVSSRAADGTFSGERSWVNTDEEGRFAFEHTTPGAWLVHVTPPYGESGWVGVESSTVQAGDRDVRIRLQRAAPGSTRVEVRVFEAETGLPLDPVDVHLTARAEPGAPTTFPMHPDKRRVAGGVVLRNLRVGAWRLWVRAERGVPAHVDFDVRQGDEELSLRVDVGGTAKIEGRVLDLAPDLPYPGHLSVMLSEAHGTPRGPGWAAAEITAHAVPDANGRFQLEGLLPGRYRLDYVGPGRVARTEVEARPGEATPVELRPVPSATVHVRGPEPHEEGPIRLKLRALDGSWEGPVHYGQRRDGGFATTFFVPAGAWEWAASFRPAGAPHSEPPRTASGQVVVVAGDVAEVWARLPR